MKLLWPVVSVVLALTGSASRADTYPSRPISLIVPFAAGGPNDVLARIVTDHMGRSLGQRILIEIVAGAGGTTGSTRAARAPADGYTIASGNLGSHGAAYSYYDNPGYRPEDFKGVGMVAGTPNFIAVRKDFPARTLADFIAEAKKNPGKITVGHAGNGSNGNLVCLLLIKEAGINLQLVPYRGSGPALSDLIAGQIDAMCDSAPTIVPQAQTGSIRALAVAQPTRIPSLPDVPTAAEAGLPGFEVNGWNALFVRSDTPADVIAKLNGALRAALGDETVRKRIEDIGATIPSQSEQSPDGLDKFVAAEGIKWGAVVRASKAEAAPK